MHTRGASDVPYYNHHAAQRPLYVNDRLPSLPLPQPQQAYSSGTSSPRVGSIGSGSILNGSSHSSYTTAASSGGPKTPSPTLPANTGLPVPQAQSSNYHNSPPSGSGYSYNQDSYSNMNQGHPQDMYYSSHMSGGQPPPPQTVTSGGMGQYGHHSQQPPLLQPGPAQYSPAPAPYPQYGYSNGLQSPQSAGHQGPGMSVQNNVLPLPAMSGQPGMPGPGYAPQQGFDTTGQIAPPGMKPRVTATLWEDEGSLCFQVEAKGVCVARREGMSANGQVCWHC